MYLPVCVCVCVQSIYKKNDSDNSGTMCTPEMRVAFKDAGQSVLLLQEQTKRSFNATSLESST